MKKFFKIAVVMMMLLVFGAGSAMAWVFTPGNRVALSADDRGDLLYGQLYLALDGGWQTDIWIANMNVNTQTSIGRSIVAKLVIRSGVLSDDLRDLNIYLTPGDVARLTLYFDTADGRVHLYSEDGSVYNPFTNTFATAANPYDQALELPNATCNDTDQYGYIEVIEIANSNWARPVTGSPNLGAMSPTGLNSPAIIRSIYHADAGAGNTMQYGNDKLVNVNNPNPNWDGNWLTGFIEIRNNAIGLISGATTMLALQNYRNTQYMFETQTPQVGTNAMNNMSEVEAVLATVRTDMPYANNTTTGEVSLITHAFPTKHASVWYNRLTCVPNAAASPSQFFAQNEPSGAVSYMLYAVNMDEIKRQRGASPEIPMRAEVNGIFTDVAHEPAVFTSEMIYGYMLTNFDEIQRFVTQDCRAGFAANTGFAQIANCPNRTAGQNWPELWIDPTGAAAPRFAGQTAAGVAPVAPVAGYVIGTPAAWNLARNVPAVPNTDDYPSLAWPQWVDDAVNPALGAQAQAQAMTQFLYGIAFGGAPVVPAELRFGGYSFSLNACARSFGVIGTTTTFAGYKATDPEGKAAIAAGGKNAGIQGVMGTNSKTGG